MGYSIDMYRQSAQELGFSTEISEGNDFFVIKLLRRNIYFLGTTSPHNGVSNTMVATHKYFMNRILSNYGFSVPNAVLVDKDIDEKLWEEIDKLQYPLVAKPAQRTSAGQDVLCHITDKKILEEHIAMCREKHKVSVTVEEYRGGFRSFRVMVFFNRVIGVVERFPAAVVGDGKQTLKELVEKENLRREGFDRLSQGSIKLDFETDFKLETLGLTLDSVPKKGERVELCFSCNSTRGGSMKSLGRRSLHKKNAKMLCQAARVLGLNMVGFDVNCVDINEPITAETGIIIEANHHPDVSIHENPMFGEPVRVTKVVMRRVARDYPFSFLLGYYRSKKNTWGMLFAKATFLITLLVGLDLLLKR